MNRRFQQERIEDDLPLYPMSCFGWACPNSLMDCAHSPNNEGAAKAGSQNGFG